MIARILEAVAAFATGAISSMGYGGVLLLMAIESACIPLPSEVIMPFAGYLVHQGRFTLHGAALAGAIGCVVGSIPAYYLGKHGGRPAIERWGRYVLVSHRELAFADRLFERYGAWVVLVGRVLPVVRTFIAFPAGVSRMNVPKFIVYTFVGSYPWCLALTWVGVKLGAAWDSDPRLKAAFHRFDLAIGLVLVAGAAWFLWHKLAERRSAGPGGARSR